MQNMITSWDTYGITELLYNIRVLLFVSDALLIILTVLAFLLVWKLHKNSKSPKE